MKQNFTHKGLERLYFIMRVSLVQLLLLSIPCLQVVTARNANGQNIEDVYVNISIENASFRSVLKRIEEQTQYLFVFSPDISAVNENVTLRFRNNSVKEVLDYLMQQADLTYSQQGLNIIIKGKLSADSGSSDIPSPYRIEGKVVSASTKVPLPGVSIVVKGSTHGTTTNADGTFSIIANKDDILVFSFIGNKTIEIPVNGRTEIEVEMEEDVASLSEVTVVGYWQNTERDRTGNVSKINAADIAKQPISNPLAAISGRMAGVYVQQNTGVPGGSFNIRIRGQNSLRNTVDDDGNLPLYVIDGIPYSSSSFNSASASNSILNGGNPLNYINPSSIESIVILKDADATAIYGSRGANGVVLITTKKGLIGKSKLDVSAYTGIGHVARKMELLDSREYLNMRREAFKNDGVPIPDYESDLVAWDTTRYTDWQRVLIGGNSHVSNVQAALSGGNRFTKYILGMGAYRESLVFPGDFSDRKLSGSVALNHSSDDEKFKVAVSINYIADRSKMLAGDLAVQAVTLPPIAPSVYDDKGDLNWENSTWNNPMSVLRKLYNAWTYNMLSSANMSYKLFNGLIVKANFGYNSVNISENSTTPLSSVDPAYHSFVKASAVFSNSDLKNYIFEPQIEYDRNIGGGKLSALFGGTIQDNSRRGQAIRATGFPSDELLSNINSASTLTKIDAGYSRYRYAAIFSRINYAIKDRYFINLTGRRDGSSRFGPGDQFANFGAVGVAWVFSDEAFMKNISFISFAKIRSSYGITGSDQIGDYGYYDTFIGTDYGYQGPGFVPTKLANKNFGWETNRKLEGALEVAFFNNRILADVSYYRNRSSNQLVGYPLASITGFQNVLFNLPADVENSGIEVNVNALPVIRNKFQWKAVLNITFPRTKLIKFPNIESSSYATQYIVGRSLTVRPSYHFMGVNSSLGTYTFEDVDSDGLFSNADYQGRKNIDQKYFGGLQNNIKVGNFEIDFLFQFVKQNGINYSLFFANPGTVSNQPVDVLRRWHKEGDVTDVQKFTQAYYGDAFTAYQNLLSSDYFYSDASFIRLKNASVSYSFPLPGISRVGFQNIRLYIQGQNLVTFSNYLGDPEVQNPGKLPSLRVFTAGIQVSM